MNNLTVSTSPHITHKSNTTRNVMLDVIIALAPALIAATLFFGYHVIINAVVCVGACVGAELLFGLIKRKKFDKEGIKKSSIKDLSAIVTGLILALNLPNKMIIAAWDFNIYRTKLRTLENMIISFDMIIVCILASIFAIMVVKMLFGGIGRNFANPAAMGRIFIFVAFGLAAVQTVGLGFTATTGATWLSGSAKAAKIEYLDFFLGNKGAAAVGETSILAILIGFVYLSIRKVIDFRIPLMVIGSAALFLFLFDSVTQGNGQRMLNNITGHLLSGGLIFGAVFMATDYATSPNTFVGQAIFACGIGLITAVIRVFANYPEGISFAIVIMNVLSGLIDKYIITKPFGYVKPQKIKTVNEPAKDNPQTVQGDATQEVSA